MRMLALTLKPNDGAANLDSSGVQVDSSPRDCGGLADTQARCEHERDELGQVPFDRPVVVGHQRTQLTNFLHSQRHRCCFSRLVDDLGVSDRVSVHGVVAGRHAAHARQHRSSHFGHGRPTALCHGLQEPVHGAGGELSKPQFTQCRQDLVVHAVAVGLAGGGGLRLQGLEPRFGQFPDACLWREVRSCVDAGAVAEGFLQGAFGGGLAAAVSSHLAGAAVGVPDQHAGPVTTGHRVDADGTHRPDGQ